MNAIVTIDSAGRFVLPKKIRDRMDLRAGDHLEVKQEGESLVLTPPHSPGGLREKGKILVFHSEEPSSLSAAHLVEEMRRQRTRDVLGE